MTEQAQHQVRPRPGGVYGDAAKDGGGPLAIEGDGIDTSNTTIVFTPITASGTGLTQSFVDNVRVFGLGAGEKPDTVKQFFVLRTRHDKRSAWLKWSPVDNAFAYNVYFGTDPQKMHNCIMVHDANDYYYKGMDKDKTYYFSIEAMNENGVSARGAVVKVE